MKKIVPIVLAIVLTSKIALACTFAPISFCVTNSERPNDLMVSGKIVKIDSNGIDVAIIEVLKGSELRDTIRIWDGTDFDCNGNFSMAASVLGALNDSILVILPVIDSLENSWEVIGDYRMPKYYGYTSKLSLKKGMLEGHIAGGQFNNRLFTMPYIDFKLYMENNMNDCLNMVGVGEVVQSQFVYYMNPVNNSLNIQFQNGRISKRTIHVFSTLGKELKSVEEVMDNIEIDFSGFSGGLYIVNILEQDGKQSIIKVIKN